MIVCRLLCRLDIAIPNRFIERLMFAQRCRSARTFGKIRGPTEMELLGDGLIDLNKFLITHNRHGLPVKGQIRLVIEERITLCLSIPHEIELQT